MDVFPAPPVSKGNYTTIYLAAKEFAIEKIGPGFTRALQPPNNITLPRLHKERERFPLAGP